MTARSKSQRSNYTGNQRNLIAPEAPPRGSSPRGEIFYLMSDTARRVCSSRSVFGDPANSRDDRVGYVACGFVSGSCLASSLRTIAGLGDVASNRFPNTAMEIFGRSGKMRAG